MTHCTRITLTAITLAIGSLVAATARAQDTSVTVYGVLDMSMVSGGNT